MLGLGNLAENHVNWWPCQSAVPINTFYFQARCEASSERIFFILRSTPIPQVEALKEVLW